VQRYGHTKKFAKHIVALVIKEQENLTDEELSPLLEMLLVLAAWLINSHYITTKTIAGAIKRIIFIKPRRGCGWLI